eukprot:Clim_evm27s109 gene=Clim_evmTU27s109
MDRLRKAEAESEELDHRISDLRLQIRDLDSDILDEEKFVPAENNRLLTILDAKRHDLAEKQELVLFLETVEQYQKDGLREVETLRTACLKFHSVDKWVQGMIRGFNWEVCRGLKGNGPVSWGKALKDFTKGQQELLQCISDWKCILPTRQESQEQRLERGLGDE